jgi:hypothetical protein
MKKHYLSPWIEEAGPAIEYADGDKAWWLNGKEITIRPMTPERLQKIILLL